MSFGYDIERLREPVRAGLHGDPGCGKTRSVITAKNNLFVNIEDRVNGLMDSIVGMNQDNRFYDIKLDDKDIAPNPYEVVKKKILGPDGLIAALNHEKSIEKFDTIFVDSLPVIADAIKNFHPHKKKDFDYWGKRQKDFYDIFDAFMSLPKYNIIFMLHTKNDKKTVVDGKTTIETDYYIPSIFSKNVDKDLTFKKLKYTFHMSQSGNGHSKRHLLQTEETDSAFARCTKKGALPLTMQFNLSKENPVGWDEVFNRINSFNNKHLTKENKGK